MRRPRKLLLHKREVNKLIGAVHKEGMTLVPLRIYFNDKGRAKLELALARGKKLHDKRETEKNRDWDRQKGLLMRYSEDGIQTEGRLYRITRFLLPEFV